MLAHAITAGHKLNEAQKTVGHGRWDKYMRLAEHEVDIKIHWPHVAKMTDEDGRNSIRAADKRTAERNSQSKGSPKNQLAKPEKVAASVKSIADGPARGLVVKATKNTNSAARDRRKNARATDDTPQWSFVGQAKDIVDKFGQDQLKEIAEFAIGPVREIEETPQAAE
jgi:hypothetical protein